MVKSAEETGTAEENGNLEAMAEEFLVGDATTLGAVSFYDFLKKENEGKRVFLCNGSACLCAGTQGGLRGAISAHVDEKEIGHICCLGRCHENGAFQYEEQNYSGRSEAELATLFDSGEGDSSDRYVMESNLETPVLLADFPGIDAYYAPLGDLFGRERDEVAREWKEASLRGRGGAGFPMGIKADGCRLAKGSPKYVVCNADEGDPGAYIDKYLMEERPHSVLFGMIAAGWFVGASAGVLYIRAEYPDSIRIIEDAIRDLMSAGWLGDDIQGSGFSFCLKVIKGAGAYICGEETALLASIEGNRPEVRTRPPFPVEYGLFGRPTLLNNVETFANLYPIVTMGHEAYRAIGTKESKGTKLLSLDGQFVRPGLYEVAMGTSLREVVYDMGGGFRVPVKAIQVGGPLGGIVPVGKIDKLDVSFESFQKEGFLLGHAGVVGIPETFPMIEYIEHLFQFTADESCGKCFPCRLGSVRGQEMMSKARSGEYEIDRALLDDLLDTMQLTSLCALGGGVPLPIKNALEYFGEELSPYFKENGA
ncbi:MAG: NADH-ubiquinone oxidoreductase-F iron-sulfur binding region domain-containing protein [Verrucomicrobiota bacterium]